MFYLQCSTNCRSAAREAQALAEDKANRAAIAKQEAHNDRIVATFNSVSGTFDLPNYDGLGTLQVI